MSGIMSMKEINKQFNGKWVAIRVTSWDGLEIANGEVLLEGSDPKELDRKVDEQKLSKGQPISIVLAKPAP
jgi:hypothetical protein